ncbi:MAG TPA: ABC transporter ATP-binding protein [Myxococcaceae bacterium]|nr:ABC transporter ATP-binding protein [Myxococcaceae bacterium]
MSDPLIRFEGLHKAFGPKKIYEGLDLEIRKGETLTVIGGSGTGKSVLLKCLIGLQEPDAGRVVFDGQDITGLDEDAFLPIRKRVAMVFQGAALFDSLTVGENIAYPLREHDRSMSAEDLHQIVKRKLELINLPGIEDMNPSDLSGGMRKRVGLARAIATDPEVILWDEPTTGLDPISTRVIDDLIVSMKRQLGCTSIVVTHDMDSAFRVSDRMAMLHGRRIVQVGTVQQMQQSERQEVRAFFDARKTDLNREARP